MRAKTNSDWKLSRHFYTLGRMQKYLRKGYFAIQCKRLWRYQYTATKKLRCQLGGTVRPAKG
jgi:hypothetical protein